MKKLFLATALLFALSAVTMAGDDKKTDKAKDAKACDMTESCCGMAKSPKMTKAEPTKKSKKAKAKTDASKADDTNLVKK
jgi:hypothetical protein